MGVTSMDHVAPRPVIVQPQQYKIATGASRIWGVAPRISRTHAEPCATTTDAAETKPKPRLKLGASTPGGQLPFKFAFKPIRKGFDFF